MEKSSLVKYKDLAAKQIMNKDPFATDRSEDWLQSSSLIAKNIDHIVVSEQFIKGQKCRTEPPVNTDYKLSDHIGVVVNID